MAGFDQQLNLNEAYCVVYHYRHFPQSCREMESSLSLQVQNSFITEPE